MVYFLFLTCNTVICGDFSPEIHINGIAWYRVFCIWLLSSIIMLLKYFVVLCISTSFSSTAEWHFIVQNYHDLFIDSLVDWNLNCLQLCVIISKSTMTIHIYMFVWIYMFISLVLIYWSEMTKLFFQSDCIILHAHKQQQYVTIWVTRHYRQRRYCLSFSF